MKIKCLFLILFATIAAKSQLIITTTLPDSILYNTLNYVQAATQPPRSNNVYTVVYNNITNPLYQMHKLYMDSAGTRQLSKVFYYNSKLHGPYEFYQMDKPLAKGRYKEGKLDGERITYWGNGTTIMEKANYTDGKRSGVWEFYKMDGTLKRRVTYDSNGSMAQDEQF